MLYMKLCAFALVALTTALSPDVAVKSMSEVQDSHEKRQLGWGWWGPSTCSKADNEVHPRLDNTLEANICVPGLLTANVKAVETGAGKATWTVDIQSIEGGAKDCVKDGLNWHIHTKRVKTDGTDASPENCGPDQTGGHWDPGLACGGASEFKATTCTALKAPDGGDWVASYGSRCTGGTPDGSSEQQKCEYGDLSGKMGPIQKNTGKQIFFDTYIQPLETYKYSSLVIHCGSPRIACANFEFN